MKKYISVILAVLFSAVALTFTAAPASAEVIGDKIFSEFGDNLEWSLDTSTGVLEISGDGVVRSDPWRDHKDIITKIVFEGNITGIYDNVFSSLTLLTEVTLPDSVKIVGNFAFKECISLKEINIPDGITAIGYNILAGTAYYNDESNWENGALYLGTYLLSGAISDGIDPDTEYKIKDNTVLIADNAFGSSTLKTVIIPESVKYIGSKAFSYSKSLEKVVMGNGVTDIGKSAFQGCFNLKEINISEALEAIGEYAFAECTSLKSLEYPKTLKNIGGYSHHACGSLENLTLRAAVTDIGYEAFFGCNSLKNVYFYGTKSDKDAINIEGENDNLLDAEWHFITEPQADPSSTSAADTEGERSETARSHTALYIIIAVIVIAAVTVTVLLLKRKK